MKKFVETCILYGENGPKIHKQYQHPKQGQIFTDEFRSILQIAFYIGMMVLCAAAIIN